MFVITARRLSDSLDANLWFGTSRKSAAKALARLELKFRGIYADYSVVERDS